MEANHPKDEAYLSAVIPKRTKQIQANQLESLPHDPIKMTSPDGNVKEGKKREKTPIDDQVIAINDAVHKLQLAMLDGITEQNQLFAAGKLISRLDYEDVVTERTIAKLCGYPLCQRFLPSDVSRRGKYRISLKEHKVYDLQETGKFCSAGCLIDSKTFSGTLQDARTSEFDSVKLNEILALFGDPEKKGSLDVNKDLDLSKLVIRENFEARGGEMSLEQWMGPSNAVEGYVPLDQSDCKSRNCKDRSDSKATQKNQEKHENPPFSEMDFTSTVIMPDEYSVSKLLPQTKQASPVGESDDGKGKTVFREQTVVPPTQKKSRFRREKEKEKKTFGVDGIDFASFGFDGISCVSSGTGNDGHSVEYSVSKQPPCSTEDPMGGQLKKDHKTLDEKSSLTGSSSASKKKSLRLPAQANKASHGGESEDGKMKTVMTNFGQTAVPPRKILGFCNDPEIEKDIKNFGFDEMGLASSAIMSDGYGVEYSVSKQPQCSMEDSLSCNLKGGLQTLDGKSPLSGSSSGSNTKGSRTKPENSGKKKISIEYHANSYEDGEELHKVQDVCSSSETVTKSCLKTSGCKKLSRSVTWADQNDGCGDLCEVRNDDIAAGPSLSSTDTKDVNSLSRLAVAEACATALSQAAEAVSSGDTDASDATAKAGIVLLPSTHQLDEEVTEEHIDDEEESTLLKWPNKPGIPDSDLFDRDQSWFDGPPEGFNLTLSSFALMWDSLFGWVSSSSLAYIYGKEESAHEEFLSVEYPRRIILGDGLSSEIKQTIAGYLARALPRVATYLRLPIAISELEKGLGSLLETMSLTGAVPSFKIKEWLVIVLLFLDALSVSRIPRIAPYISNRDKILEGSGIGNEEYETMKDILLPLGRVPQFATRSGA
ncbi:PREDICTED: putative RNA polymerase II subunit B1 CTD phosphatase RPAP2 homolog [Camelina sativa]|uniref:RNA polymerase II subunit B1 CTD phosphatase RPAP2 homolog n=1 Tax=Camelina sativa TaxID=90675 RepID=A0ABM0Y194_CAMSA|nr:PREDICTED: putative RNA polymerase II subunit B1 CTD phosphatase RPAP2 homolog [Camelina sativa]